MIRSPFRIPPAETAPSPAPPQRPAQRVRSIGRLIYLLLVVSFAIYLIGRLTGHLLVLNATGLVTSDRFVVGAAYTARVAEVHVHSGDKVQAGQVIARLESTEVLASLAQLAQNIALIEAQREALFKRQRVVEAVIPVAQRRLAVAREGEKRLARDTGNGAVTQNYRSTILTEAFEAERDLATLQSELASSDLELTRISSNLAEVQAAIEATRQSYAEGIVTAPLDGTVSAAVASPGQVLTAGEPVMELLAGERYVLAYLANGRLFRISPDDRVVLTDGGRTSAAHVQRIDSVADNLPPEFRTAFGAYERRQVVRVASDSEMPFPYLSRVRVISPWSFSHILAWSKAALSDFMGWANGND